MTSTGRGGAGNIYQKSDSPAPEDFNTPTIKSDTYTTGRGGAGNMVINEDPERAREAQDVKPVYRSGHETEGHFGRGGAANTVKLDGEGARVEGEGSGHGHGHGHENEQGHEHGLKGLAEKGKELLTGKKH